MGTPIIYFLAKKMEQGVFPCLKPSFTIKVRYKVVKITLACFHEKAVLKILPSNV